MKKMIALTLATVALASAHAAENTIVLKDTRQYDDYTSSIQGLVGCTMPANNEDPEPGDCAVKKARYIIAGMLLIRNPKSELCSYTAWETERTPLTYQGRDVSVPTISENNEVFACNADGTPMKKIQAAVDAAH
ncbi:hypothetical protein [Comamonas testosteroni]|nr:hypothetical protein [Comamonas testosteroni]